MNRDDIIRMALEAGIDYSFGAEIERFAALVAAAERHRACLVIKEYLIVKDYCDGDVHNAIEDIMNDDIVVLPGWSEGASDG